MTPRFKRRYKPRMLGARAEFQQILTSEFAKRKTRNSAYSLRAFARSLGVQASSLSEILSGKRTPGPKMAARLLDQLAEGSASAELLTSLKSEQKPPYEYSKLELSTFSVISKWHYFAIVTLCQFDDFDDNVLKLASRLRLPEATIHEAIGTLLELGLITRHGDSWRATSQNLAVDEDVANAAIRASHDEHLSLAKSALFDRPVDQRNFMTVNIATNKSELKLAAKRVKSFLRTLCRDLESAKDKDVVFRVGSQIFPLTSDPESPRSQQ